MMRVWHISNVPSEPEYWPVETVHEAHRLIAAIARQQLRCECVSSNVFGLEILQDNEWQEWENDNGYLITDVQDDLSDPE